MSSKKPAKRKPGRPPGTGTGRNGRRVNLYLAQRTIDRAEKIGDGSISAGVQIAVDAMQPK